MKKTYIILAAFIIIFMSFSFAQDNKSVLIINSYSTEYSWTVDTIEGVKDKLGEYSPSIDIKTEYMDTKNNNTKDYIRSLYQVYKGKYKDVHFDGIIVCDDNGLRFILEYANDLFGETPIFYCGINSTSVYEEGILESLVGIIEEASIRETLDIALEANPDLSKVYLLKEESTSGKITTNEILKEMDLYENIDVELIEGNNLHEISKNINDIDEVNSILLLTFFAVDKEGNVYNSVESTFEKLIKNSNIPVYGLWDFGFGHGVIGGKMISGYSQGVEVSKYLIDYFESGKYEAGTSRVENIHMYDYEAMMTYGIDPSIIPENSIVINRPISFTERHRDAIMWSIVIITVLGIYIILLRVQIRRGIEREKNTLEELMEAKKMSSLVSIMNRLSHEMNTPLGNLVTSLSHMDNTTRKIKSSALAGNLTSKDLSKALDSYEAIHDIMEKGIDSTMKISESFREISKDNSVPKIKYNLLMKINVIVDSLKKKNEDIDTVLLFDIDCSDKLQIYARPGALKTIFSNLIQNSIDHGFEAYHSGQISIKAYEDDSNVYIEYSDNGKGKAEICSKVFEPFYTEKKWSEHQGLGLYTVQNIIHSMDGSIKCTPGEVEGLIFSILIPKDIVK